jgi:hypothetical protein
VAVVVLRGVVVGEEQTVGEEAVVAELARKQTARDLRTQQQRRPMTAGQIRLHLQRTHPVFGITMLLSKAK